MGAILPALLTPMKQNIRTAIDPYRTPLNTAQLAKALGRSPWFVTAMKAAGFRFRFCMTTFLSDALDWLEAHPDFRSQDYKVLCRLRRGTGGKPKRP